MNLLNGFMLRRYALSGVQAFKACLRREWTLMTRHGFIYIFRTCQVGWPSVASQAPLQYEGSMQHVL